MSTQLYCTKEVARILRVSPSTLSKWRVSRRQKLPFVKLGRAVRYRIEDVEAFLISRLPRLYVRRHASCVTHLPVAAEPSHPAPIVRGSASCAPPSLPVCWLKDVMLPEKPLFLVDNVIPRAGLTFIYGPPGSAKSFLALHLAHCVSLGREFFGQRVERGGVLYLALEGGAGIRLRLVAAREHDEALHSAPFALIDHPTQMLGPVNERGKLYESIHAIRQQLAAMGIELKLIVIDTFARALGAADENSSTDIGEMLAVLEGLARESGAAIVVIAHPGKNQSSKLRGHSSMLGACDAAWEVKVGAGGRRLLSCVKIKDGKGDVGFAFELEEIHVVAASGVMSTCRVRELGLASPSKAKPGNDADRVIVRTIEAMLAETPSQTSVSRQRLLSALQTACPRACTKEAWAKRIRRRIAALAASGRIVISKQGGADSVGFYRDDARKGHPPTLK